MLYNWMNEDWVEELDLEGIVSLDETAINNAKEKYEMIQDRVVTINNMLNYACFLRDNLNDIKHNYLVTDEIMDKAYSILRLTKVKEVRKFLSVVSFENLAFYVRFLRTCDIDRVDLRFRKLSVPKEPFSKCIEDLENEVRSTTDRTRLSVIRSYIENYKKCLILAQDIEKSATTLIEYDISDVFEEFDFSKIGSYEALLGNLLEMFEASIAEIEEKEYILRSWKDQLEMIETIVKDSITENLT